MRGRRKYHGRSNGWVSSAPVTAGTHIACKVVMRLARRIKDCPVQQHLAAVSRIPQATGFWGVRGGVGGETFALVWAVADGAVADMMEGCGGRWHHRRDRQARGRSRPRSRSSTPRRGRSLNTTPCAVVVPQMRCVWRQRRDCQIVRLANVVVQRGAGEEEPVDRVELFQIAPDKRRV